MTDNYTWPILTLPCLIIGSWLMCVGIGFIILAIKNQDLPNYFNRVIVPVNDLTEEIKIQDDQKEQNQSSSSKNTLIGLGVLFFFLFCGIDSYFQSQTYTYGLCGPLGMSAESAGWLNSIYFGHYLLGRIISIPLSTKISPPIMILITLLGCLASALILVIFGTHLQEALFIATGLMGSCICFLFPSGINWLTSNIPDMSSRQVSIIFLGSNLANCVFPPLASKLFNEIGPTSVFHMTIVALIITLICYSLMVITIRKSNSERQLTQNSPQTSV